MQINIEKFSLIFLVTLQNVGFIQGVNTNPATMKVSIITDEQTLVSARTQFGNPIPVYDDGRGTLFIHRDSMGISGIVRALTWEDAYSICEDEFFPAASETHEDFIREYGEEYTEDAAWQESYGFRPNGGEVYQKDLNGDYLDELTPELLGRLGITLEIETPAEDEPAPRWFAWHESRWMNQNGRAVFTMQGRYGASYSRVSPRHLFRRCTTHSHYSPDCDAHAAAW